MKGKGGDQLDLFAKASADPMETLRREDDAPAKVRVRRPPASLGQCKSGDRVVIAWTSPAGRHEHVVVVSRISKLDGKVSAHLLGAACSDPSVVDGSIWLSGSVEVLSVERLR